MGKFVKNPEGIPSGSYRASKKIILGIIIILGIFIVNSVVFALQVSWPSSPAGTRLTDDSQLGDLIKYLYEWGIFLGGLAAFIALLIAGFQYLTSVGDPARMKDAVDRIKSAFLGLILLLGSWLILNNISPQFTTLQLPPFEPGTPPVITIEEIKEKEFTEPMGLKPCTKAEIIRTTTTIVLNQADCSSKYQPAFSIITDELFNVKGYINGNATTCVGWVILYAAKDCNTKVSTFNLSSSNENVHVEKVVQSALFFSP